MRTAIALQWLVAGVAAFSSWPASQSVRPHFWRRETQFAARRCFDARGCCFRAAGVFSRTQLKASASADDWQALTDESTGKLYYWNPATGETAWTPPGGSTAAPLAAGSDGGLPIQFTGEGTKTKVLYQQILQDALASVQGARAAGKRRLQVEFPLDDKDEGKTLVKRFELMTTFAEEFAAALGLPRVQRVGEDIEIRDNVTPGGGGEYLTNEGIYGYRLSSADNSEQVLLVLLAGVDLERLNDLESLLQGSTTAGRQLPGGVPLEVSSTGVLSSLDVVGYVKDMSVNQDATIVLINTGLDKFLAGSIGFFGLGGASKFLQSFEICYYLKRASTGFMQFDIRDASWRLWGVPQGSAPPEYQLIETCPQRPAFWEAEQKIKNF